MRSFPDHSHRAVSVVCQLALCICVGMSDGRAQTTAPLSGNSSTLSNPDDSIVVELPESESEAESTVFDLYLGDEFQGAVVASYTDDWFQIDDPDDALAQYQSLQGSKGKLVELLTGRIDKTRTIEGVGSVYYDLGTFRIVLKPDPSLLKSKSLDWRQKLGDPEPGFSLQQTLGFAASQDSDSATLGSSTAFTHRGLVSYEDIFFRSNGFITQDQSYQLNEATLGTIVDDYDARAGLLQMRSQTFTPSLRFAGFQFETSQNIFVENENARGSKLEIFVPSRATVQFFRDSQLLAVQILDFGLQEIDTTAFPQGSYEVDIVITDSTGKETKDKRFFTKSGFLASRSAPIVFFSGGAVRDVMDVLSTPLGQAGVRMRASDFFDLGLGLAATDQRSIGSADINGFYDVFRFGFGGATSTSGDFARYGTLAIIAFDFSVSGRLAHADGEATASASQTPVPDAAGFLPQLARAPTDLVIQSQRSKTLSVSRSFGSASVRYNIQDNRVGDGPNVYARGPTLDYRMYDDEVSNVVLRGAYFDTESGSNTSLQLFYRYRFSPTLTLNSQLMRRWQRDQEEFLLLAGATYNSQAYRSGAGSRLQALEEARRSERQGEKLDSLTSTIQGNVQADYLTLGTFLRDNRVRDGDSRTTLGVNAETTVFVSNEGDIDLSMPPLNEAVFVAEIEGNLLSAQDKFDVLVNGQRQGIVARGSRAIISLTPYREYSISLSAQEGSSLVDYDVAKYKVTLFPGNVAKRVWSVDKVFVLLGRVIDEEGQPIVRERIKGAKGYGFTEADGTFQLEVSGREPLSIESPRRRCTIDVTMDEVPEYVLDVGDVVCRSEE